MFPKLANVFKIQSMSRQALLGSMDTWGARTAGMAMRRGSAQTRTMKALFNTGGARSALSYAAQSARAPALRGAMWGAGLGVAGSVGGDAMNNNLNMGSFGRALGGGMRGGLMGGAIGGLGGVGFGRGMKSMSSGSMRRAVSRARGF